MRASWQPWFGGGLVLGAALLASAQANEPQGIRAGPLRNGDFDEAPNLRKAAPLSPGSVKIERARVPAILGNDEVPNLRKAAPLSPGSVKIGRARVPAILGNDEAPAERPKPLGEPGRPPVKRIALALEGGGTHDDDALKLIGGGGQLAAGGTVEIPSESVAVVSSTAAREIAAHSALTPDEKTLLPWIVLDDDPEVPNVRATRPFLQLAEPVHWDRARSLHVAEFWFGLDVEQGKPGRLAHPIDVLFSVTCGEIAPRDRVKIAQSGIAGYVRIAVGCSASDKNADAPERLTLRLDDGQLDYPFEIPRLAGQPSLFPSTKHAEGLGLSTIDLTVSRREEDGTLMPVTADLPVTLTTESGALDVTQLVIPKGAAEASVSVRPRGIGELNVTAHVAGTDSKTVTIDLDWPTLASVAAVLGGGLGGLLAARNKRRRMPSRVIEGALVGLVVTALCLVLPDFSALGGYLRTTEVALFALSALAGFVGSHLIERAARVVFPSLRDERPARKSPA